MFMVKRKENGERRTGKDNVGGRNGCGGGTLTNGLPPKIPSVPLGYPRLLSTAASHAMQTHDKWFQLGDFSSLHYDT